MDLCADGLLIGRINTLNGQPSTYHTRKPAVHANVLLWLLHQPQRPADAETRDHDPETSDHDDGNAELDLKIAKRPSRYPALPALVRKTTFSRERQQGGCRLASRR